MVYQNSTVGASRNRSCRKRFHPIYARELSPDLSELDAKHPRLVHLTAVMVGTSHSGVALRVRRDHRCARDADFLPKVRRLRIEAGSGRPGYVVLIGITPIHRSWLAGGDARSGSVLSDVAADHRFRYSVFLGCAHDHAGLLVHGGTGEARHKRRGPGRPYASIVAFGTRVPRVSSVSRSLHSRTRARCRAAEDVEDQG